MSASTPFQCSVNRGVRCAAGLAAVTWLMMALPAGGMERLPATPERPVQGLSAADWSSIRAAYEAYRHAAFAVEGGYIVRNPGQQWRTRFDGRGFETTPDAGGWSWGLELVGYGRADSLNRARQQAGLDFPSRDGEGAGSQPACVEASGGRVSYHWDETLTEWYVNDTRGLEHGYTVHRRPEGITGGTPMPHLRFTLAVRGDLRPRIGADGRDVTFIDEAGAAVVNYRGLTVIDAAGAAVPAWFEPGDVDPKSEIPDPQFLRLVVDDSNATYPLTIDPIAQQAYLKAPNAGADDRFGESVAVSGDTVVVGAPGEDSSATGVNGDQADNSAGNAGAAYVFVRSGDVWSQQAYLKASNTGANDQFGHSVAISGDTVVVGALYEDSNATGVNGNQGNNSAADAGAAYVFVRSGGVWSQQAYLKASNTEASDSFGKSVAISGDTVVVGALWEDSNATGVNGNQGNNSAADAGAAYVFIRSGGVWSQQAYLKASNTDEGDLFGTTVSIDGDLLVVGATGESSSATGVDGNQLDNSAGSAGAAYLFARSGANWSQQAYLKASNTESSDFFGNTAISGETIVVGAPGEDALCSVADNNAPTAGAVYVFQPTVDADGDGVIDAVDVCPNNAPGLPVDCAGRPLRDCNNDCLVDGLDVPCIVAELVGP